MVGATVVSKWTLCVTSPPVRNSAGLNPHCPPARVNLRTELAAFRPQFRLFSRDSSSRRRLRASSSAESGIFLPHLVASMVCVLPFRLCELLCFLTLKWWLNYEIRNLGFILVLMNLIEIYWPFDPYFIVFCIVSGGSWGDLHYGETWWHTTRPCKRFCFSFLRLNYYVSLWSFECDCITLSYIEVMIHLMFLGRRNHLSLWEEGI